MKGSSRRAGFTIVETLMVLVISSGIFLAIMLTMSGRQGKAQFLQATKNIQADVQQAINEVSSGFYPSTGSFTCQETAAKPVFSASTNGQGTNEDCVFLGKVIQFKVAGTDPEQYNVFSVAALRECGSLTTCTTLAGAAPQVIDGAGFNITETKTLDYGLTVKSATAGAVGFISEMGSLDSAGSYNSGSQPVDVMPVSGTTIGMTRTGMISAINGNLAGSAVNPTGGFTVCFRGGATNQTALLTIGSNGHDLSVKMEVKSC